MPSIGQITEILDYFAPAELAEEWDNVGLLVGDRRWSADKVMTCLTVTPATVAEAVGQGVNLIVAHHPLPFHPLRTISSESIPGQLLLQLITARIGVYSAHTAFDSAQAGINQHLAIGLGLQEIRPLVPASPEVGLDVGSGRMGWLGETLPLTEMAQRVKNFLDIRSVQIVGADDQEVSRVAIACGSGGSFLAKAIEHECDCLVTGETTFHTCLEAESKGIGLVLPGHFASERFALLSLADYLNEQIPDIEVWASRTEQDPLRTI